MTTNDRIIASAYAALRGDQPVPKKSGYCLALVRMIVEDALFGGAWRFYHWRSRTASDKPARATAPWARDMEASLRAAGMALDDLARDGPPGDPTRHVDVSSPGLEPGDLLFRWDTAKHEKHGVFVGHVAILMPGQLVLENVRPSYRDKTKGVWRGATRLTPLGTWPVTTVARFDPEKPPA